MKLYKIKWTKGNTGGNLEFEAHNDQQARERVELDMEEDKVGEDSWRLFRIGEEV